MISVMGKKDPCQIIQPVNPLNFVNLVQASQETRTKFYLPAIIYLGAEHYLNIQNAGGVDIG